MTGAEDVLRRLVARLGDAADFHFARKCVDCIVDEYVGKLATLGSCNCTDDCTDSERTGTCEMEYVSDWMSWHCKSCDHMDMAPRNPKPRYCKWCGRKVVSE